MTTVAADSQVTFFQSLEFEHGLRDPNWLYMRRFLADLQRDFERKSQFTLWLAACWMKSYDMLRAFEEDVMFSGNANAFEREYFQGCLAIAKGHGRLLIALLEKNNQYSVEALGFNEEDIKATLDEIETMEGTVYRSLAPAQKAQLAEVFGGRNRT